MLGNLEYKCCPADGLCLAVPVVCIKLEVFHGAGWKVNTKCACMCYQLSSWT